MSPPSTSSSPAAAVTSTAGNPEASISGAPSLATLLQQVKQAVRPQNTNVDQGLTLPDGSVTYGGQRYDGLGGQFVVSIGVNPKDKSLITVSCTSPVGPADAVRAVCTDLKYDGADPTTARAWVVAAAKKIPAGDSKTVERNDSLNGLHWLVYLDSTGQNEVVTVSARDLPSS